MASRQSTTRSRARKKQEKELSPDEGMAAQLCAGPNEIGTVINPTQNGRGTLSLEQTIEIERGRLTAAQSILGCLHVALLSGEEKNRFEPGCADVAAMALTLVREAVNRLDYVYLRPLIVRRANTRSPKRNQIAGRR